MTPLEYAEELRKLAADELVVAGATVPSRTWSQLGDIVLECEALVSSVTNMIALELGGPPCDYGQVGIITISIGRECANVSNDDGTTNVEAALAVAAQQDRDGEALWNVGEAVEAFLQKDFAMAWAILGGIAITTLTLTIGIP